MYVFVQVEAADETTTSEDESIGTTRHHQQDHPGPETGPHTRAAIDHDDNEQDEDAQRDMYEGNHFNFSDSDSSSVSMEDSSNSSDDNESSDGDETDVVSNSFGTLHSFLKKHAQITKFAVEFSVTEILLMVLTVS